MVDLSDDAGNQPKLPAVADKADDLEAIRAGVVDAAGVSVGLWVSYLFALSYLFLAVSGVTHRDLLFENPVRMPVLDVDLPLKTFFRLGPVVFLIVHAYALLHFVLLADKIRVFNDQLRAQIPDDPNRRACVRRQLPINIFVQFLAGPEEVRNGLIGWLLKLIAWVSLAFAPVALLTVFQLQFLPYHDELITWQQRSVVLTDVVLLWALWPRVVRSGLSPDGASPPRHGPSATILMMAFLTVISVPLVLAVATFPGESSEAMLRPLPLNALRKWLVAGEVDEIARRRKSPWSNTLVLPGLDVSDPAKHDAGGRISALPEIISLRGRNLEGAVLINARLRGADLSEALLQGALFNDAQLQGASFDNAHLQAASFYQANLRGASLSGAKLQGASLNLAELQGASLNGANLQGASIYKARLQGVVLDKACLQGASLQNVFVWRADPTSVLPNGDRIENATARPQDECENSSGWPNGAQIENATTEPQDECEDLSAKPCSWSIDSFSRLRSEIENVVPKDQLRDDAFARISRVDPKKWLPEDDQKTEESWRRLESGSLKESPYEAALEKQLRDLGCAADGAPYVVSGLIRSIKYRFPKETSELRTLAAEFLKDDCAGARGLSEDDRAELIRLRDLKPADPTAKAP